jgi:hypothetical protein
MQTASEKLRVEPTKVDMTIGRGYITIAEHIPVFVPIRKNQSKKSTHNEIRSENEKK